MSVKWAKPERTSISFLHSGHITLRLADTSADLLNAVTLLVWVKLAELAAHLFFVGFAVVGELVFVAAYKQLVNDVVELCLVYLVCHFCPLSFLRFQQDLQRKAFASSTKRYVTRLGIFASHI